ncbi:DUF4232 domain-containing protein [Paractinoplanes toevensis]|uniref:DUF4232 domain-containing protein n=1 Tax=Paractinoplanes toevensis TaxID=571911 RepID=A0A919W2Z1_9ACTN|nr:DUF4232 domain-containing protein [Actinoplanes toevensis]GIM90005.1 hypothetical protein Ato02nite_017980 [Actinoplanes toevensis]
MCQSTIDPPRRRAVAGIVVGAGENKRFGTSYLDQEPSMNSRHLRVVVLGAIGVGLALSQQACANDAAAPAAAAPSQTSPGQAAGASVTPEATADSGDSGGSDQADGSGGSTGKTSTVPGCLNNDVTLDVTFQPQAVVGHHRLGLVTVTNSSDHTCKVRGHFAIALINPADEDTGVPLEMVDQPGEAITVKLKPRTSAFAGIKWTVCDKGDSACHVGNSLRYNLQSSGNGKTAELEGFPAGEKNAITMTSLQIGTLQPIRTGVVAW